MAQAARIMEILQEMIHIDSETNTPKERQIELYLQQFFSGMDVISGLIHVPNDRCERSVVYGLIRGKTNRTVIFMNHHDVVDIEAYGNLRDQAFDPEELQKALAHKDMSEDVRRDLESGEWLFGRGPVI